MALNNERKPALTAEEWRHTEEAHIGDGLSDHIDDMLGSRDIDAGLHAAAAISLWECRQPHGFSWEDVDALRQIAKAHSYRPDPDNPFRRVYNVADRIAVLLPPREGK